MVANSPAKAYFNEWAHRVSELHPRLLSDSLHKLLFNRYRVTMVTQASQKGPLLPCRRSLMLPLQPAHSCHRLSEDSGMVASLP